MDAAEGAAAAAAGTGGGGGEVCVCGCVRACVWLTKGTAVEWA